MMKRETPLLPISDAREAALFFVVGALCFLAALAALTTRGTYKAAEAWGAQIEGDITVVMRDTDRRTAEQAADRVTGLASVFEARILSREEVEALLEPSLGPGGMPDGLPVPILMVVQADTSVGDPAQSIEGVLDDLSIDGDVAGNAGYAENVRGALGVLRLVALSIVALLSATAVAVIAFATHAALLARRDIVDVLHLSGAEDRFIAGLFERRFWVLALQAGLGGSVAALMITALIVFTGSGSDGVEAQLLPRLSLDFWDIVILLVTPLMAGLAARIAARVTVLASLKDTL
ncbi:MAG: cell division protein FtsX [Hyphomonas sp.]|jgi:cell division transport system permease protein|nr:cell division protein FtsX [Henriciella sp.]MBO6695186.1 cell division protein FtsX [Henriciella sp.]MCH9751306.1 cell division protein FtsX [Alphaproteobacteria bacterium]MCR9224624.1 cell division protein FtsX [Hyphomonas sp.]